MADRLTALLAAPLPDVDTNAWQAALADARATLADLAVRRAGARAFRVTDHEIRTALEGGPRGDERPFVWSASRARRPIGVAAVRLLARGAARSPAEAVRMRIEESGRWVGDGSTCASPLDHWLAALTPAGRAAVTAEAVTWSTRLWCALDWASLPTRPVIGRDRWWDSPHSALLALRARADVWTGRANLVVLSGPRRDSVRAELALVPLVEALRSRGRAAPERVVGWWPDSGHVVRLEPGPAVLSLGVDAVATALAGGPTSVRSAA